MSKKIFTESDIVILRSNKYVKNVSSKSITYNNEFKLHFIAEYEKGVMPSVIFKEAGFDPEMLGRERIKTASFRWRRAYKENDVMGLEDTRRLNSGRPRSKERSLEEIVEKQKAEIEYLKAEVELLKKLELRERQVIKGKLIPSQVFKIIERIIAKHNLKKVVRHLCKIAGVSTSGYYHYLSTRNIRLNRHQQDQKDFELISKAYRLKGYNKGSRGIYMVLRNVFGVIINRKKIQRLMRKFSLVCPIRKANPYKRMAKATKEHRVVPNILNRDFKKGKPGQILLTDITYIPFKDRFAYLSVIKDSVTNEVLAHYLSSNIKLDIATKTIEILLEKHKKRLKSDAYVHSDQGVHYTSPVFQKLLKKSQLGQSMSRRGNCWDNAPMESFFGHMKDEINYKSCLTFEDLQCVIDDYMNYYNKFRHQWNLKKLTPAMYRSQLLTA